MKNIFILSFMDSNWECVASYDNVALRYIPFIDVNNEDKNNNHIFTNIINFISKYGMTNFRLQQLVSTIPIIKKRDDDTSRIFYISKNNMYIPDSFEGCSLSVKNDTTILLEKELQVKGIEDGKFLMWDPLFNLFNHTSPNVKSISFGLTLSIMNNGAIVFKLIDFANSKKAFEIFESFDFLEGEENG